MSDLKSDTDVNGNHLLLKKLFGEQHADQRLLSFSLGTEKFALPLLAVREVISVIDFTPLPFTPNYILGVINIRGQIITVIDLGTRLSIIDKSHRSEAAVIVCESGNIRVALMVDSIDQVINPEPQDIQEKPEVESSIRSRFVKLIYRKDNTIITLIDTAKILNVDTFMDSEINQAA
jgi:purine-binding chemotaxis protein CheW